MHARRMLIMTLLFVFLLPFIGAAPVAQAAEELSIVAQPLVGPVGTPITITGQGAPPHAALEIVGGRRASPGGCAGGLKGGQGNATYFARTAADGAGNFAVTFTLESAGDPYLTMAFFRVTTAFDVTPTRSSPRACFDVTNAWRTFPATGKTVRGDFLRQWEEHGGLPLNGYPISDVAVETLENGKSYLVQYFERVRMEYHDDLSVEPQTLLGAFGRQLHPADPPVAAIAGAAYSPETGHNVTRPAFVEYWRANGGLAQFGYPLSEELEETIAGQTYRVQYFERARFEWHPEIADAAQRVQLGQFGRVICGERCP